MKKLLYVTLIVVVALFGLTFTYKNPQPVELNYYFGLHFQGRLPLLLLITLALGLVAGYLLALLHSLGARRRFSKTRKIEPALVPVPHNAAGSGSS